ncbi:MAG TPA: DUF3662 domain-containing protein [Blastocatellia bacterium]|nr:DUF3662 domain-containing protein [Blastocatellia bacterium]
MGIQDLVEGFRRWLDGEESAAEKGPARPRGKWEDFMVAIAREVEAVMQHEMFTPPGGPTYIPREYVVFLSSDDDADWQGEKREGLERGLHYVLGQRASELAGTTEFQTKSFIIELRTDSALERGQFRVQPVWDTRTDRTTVKPRRPPQPVAARTEPEPSSSTEADDESTVVRPKGRTAAASFNVAVTRTGTADSENAFTASFSKAKITIGRGSKQMSVDLKLEGDLEVSRHHASLEMQDGQFVVTCEGRNSIFVDATEVMSGESAIVLPGQKIAICTFVLKPVCPGDPATGGLS